jgi:acyl-CoA thioesterase
VSFASATAVATQGDGLYAAEIQPGWDIGGNANGGYLLCIALRAMRDASTRPDVLTATAHYLAPGKTGPVTIATDVVKQGRTITTVTGALEAGDRRLVQTIAAFGDLAASATAPERVDATPPELPPPDDCMSVRPANTFPPPFMGQIELRLHPDDAGFSRGAPSGEPRVRGWFRLRDEEPIDTLALVLATDAFPPTAFNARLPVGWTPTVELTTHLRARPAPGWLRCQFTTRFVTGGFLEEDGEIWDATDRIVAQSRQLALVPRG